MTKAKDIRETIRASYLQPAFLICAGVLAIAASTMSAAIKLSGIYLRKEPVLLKKPLSQLGESDLTPYKVVTKQRIENPDVLETMGTEDYIQWVLEDTSAPADSPVRLCMLFITYYSTPDNVPHAPEECYIGGGYERISAEEVTLKISSPPLQTDGEWQINARYVVFAKTNPNLWGDKVTFPVMYTFSVNGEYAGSREDTRLILNKNLFGKFSYFSKVEWNLYNISRGGVTYPNKQETVAASEKLLAIILPVLEKEHWPSGLWHGFMQK
jgi:hypothetical protein